MGIVTTQRIVEAKAKIVAEETFPGTGHARSRAMLQDRIINLFGKDGDAAWGEILEKSKAQG